MQDRSRKGNLVIGLAIALTTVMAVGALVVDLGYARVVHAQLQDGADAAAHGGVAYLDGTEEGLDAARQAAVALAAMNVAAGNPIRLDANDQNAADGDVVIGFWDWEVSEFVPSLDPDDADAVLVRARDADVATFFGSVAFGSGGLAASADSIAVMPPPTPAGAVECYIPLAVPDCMFDDYPGQTIIDVDMVLNPDNMDNVGWALMGEDPTSARALRDQIDDCGSSGEVTTSDIVDLNNGELTNVLRTLGDAVLDSDTTWDSEIYGEMGDPYSKSYVTNFGGWGNTFEGPIIVFDGGDDCDEVKFNQEAEVTGFVWAAVYDVRSSGPAADKNIKVRLNTAEEFDYGTGGGGELETGLVYQPPPMIVR